MKAIGIDLGTTNSIVAVIDGGQMRAIGAEDGSFLVPSVVRYQRDLSPIVGAAAKSQLTNDPRNTLSSIKRLLGRGLDDLRKDETVRYELEQEGTILRICTVAGAVTPIEVSSEILRHLKNNAETYLGTEIRQAVITVPAYFDDAQRQATRHAARLAGLEVMRLINEPTAAALAYGLDKKQVGTYAIFDLGGGTFDISILELVDGIFEVQSTGGDTHLGGDDFDYVLATELLGRFGYQIGDIDLATHAQVMAAAEAAKQTLTDEIQVEVNLDIHGQTHSSVLTRKELSHIIRPILKRLENPCRQALGDANLRVDQLDGVVLVGGSTRSPVVRQFVADMFGHQPICDLDPDLVVALGAASQADLLSSQSELRVLDGGDVLLLDVTPLSLGLETMGGVVEKILPRCSQIPASRAQEFTTYKEGQTAMDIHVVQGERELVDDCRSLARFQLTGIPPGPAGQAKVRVIFQLDANGLLSVSATELNSGVKAAVDVAPSYGLDDTQVEAMLQASLDYAEQDVFARMLKTAIVEADRVLHALDVAKRRDGDLLTSEEATAINQVTASIKEAMDGDDHTAIQDLTETLEKITAGFAHRRMDRALNEGFKNMEVTELERAIDSSGDQNKNPPEDA